MRRKTETGRGIGPLVRALIVLVCAALSACQGLSPFGQRPPTTLLDTYWKLVRVGGRDVAVRGDAREPYLLLTRRGHRVQGFAGCNEIVGRYRHSRARLRLESKTGSQMSCVGKMGLEQAYINALNRTAHARVTGQRLTLLDARDRPLATFRARLMD